MPAKNLPARRRLLAGSAAWTALLILVTLFWGNSFIAVKVIVRHVSPLELVTVRFVPVALIFAALLLPTRGREVWAMVRTDGWRLALNDTRKFARAWLVRDPQAVLAKLGPEPFDPALTPQVFHSMLQRTRRQIKPLLLDQTVLAGLGNIYTDEALHLAGIHPLAAANRVSPEHSARLLEAIRGVLQAGSPKAAFAGFDLEYEFPFGIGDPFAGNGFDLSVFPE